MARRKPNGRAGSARSTFDTRQVVSEAEQVTAAASAIARITSEVSDGADLQVRSLDRMLGGVTGMAQDMAAAAQQVTASIGEMGGSIRAVSRDTESLTVSVTETSTAIEQM